MRSPLGRIAFCLVAGALTMACDQATDGVQVLQADLAGSNEVPARATAATGVTGFTIEGSTVYFSLQVNNINAVLFAHIHSGSATVNGPVRVFLYRGPTTGAVDGILSSGSFAAADVTGISFDQLLNEMRAGTAYVNVHSPTYPGGEVRGQIRLLQ